MTPLLIRVKHVETGKSDEAGYKRSPVRIGRNSLNDLAIDEPFVSQWHAVVRFDDDGTRYIDLGSTNGTTHDGEKLEKNSELTVEGSTELKAGPLVLTFVRTTVDKSQLGGRRRSAFKLSSSESSGDARTVALGQGAPAGGVAAPPMVKAPELGNAPPPGAPPPAMVGADVGAATEAMAAPSMLPMQLVQDVQPLYSSYRREWESLFEKLSEALVGAAPQERDALVHMLKMQFPDVLREARCQRLLSELGVDPQISGTVDAAGWVGRLTDGGKKKRKKGDAGADQVASMERAGAVLECFAESYIALRKGLDEMSKELSLGWGDGFDDLDQIRDARKLLGYLMDDQADGEDRVRELSRAYAEIAAHQIALVSAATEGTRATLMQMSPHVLSGAGQAIAKAEPGFFARLFPYGAARNWYKYVDLFVEQTNGDRFTQTLFGKSFGRMYRRVVGR